MTWPPHRPGAGDLRLRAGATLQIGATAPNDLPLNIMSSWSHRWVSGVVPARTGSDSRTVVKHRGTTVQLTLRPRVPLDGIAGGRRGRGGATGGSDEPGCERLVACRNSGPVQGGGVWSGTSCSPSPGWRPGGSSPGRRGERGRVGRARVRDRGAGRGREAPARPAEEPAPEAEGGRVVQMPRRRTGEGRARQS